MKIDIKKLLIVFIIGFIVTMGISFSINNNINEYKDGNFKIEYDNTWKLISKDIFKLEHKKSRSILSIQTKILEENYIDTRLDSIIKDIVYSIEEQNKGYDLINVLVNPSNKYQSYSYLYENDMEQVLVNIYKYNEKLVIVYYKANSKYYDIVLDSVDTILNSLEIFGIEEVNLH